MKAHHIEPTLPDAELARPQSGRGTPRSGTPRYHSVLRKRTALGAPTCTGATAHEAVHRPQTGSSTRQRKGQAVTSAVTTDTSARPGYGQLLRTPGALSFLLPGFAARQPFAMLTISIVLLVQHTTGSFGSAGIIAAVTGVSMALFAPQMGKLADRIGQSRVLVPEK